MPPVLTACVTMMPPSESTATDNGQGLGSGWPGFWNVTKTAVKSFHPGFDPGQRPDQPDSPWIQLKIQPKELALRLAQKAIPANSYFNTINQVAMACLALASLPGCGGQTPQDRNPETEPPGTAASTTPPGCRSEPMPVQSVADLAKIGGEHPCYPPDGKYIQTTDIDAGNHSPIPYFTGEYNGNGKSISNLNNCLFLRVEDSGIVRDLVVEKADVTINDRRFAGNKGVVTCEARGHALLKNITVEHSCFKLQQADDAYIYNVVRFGMLAGHARGNLTLAGNRVRHSNVSADIAATRPANVGILIGYAFGSISIDSNVIDNCRITTGNTYSNSHLMIAGLMAGKMVGIPGREMPDRFTVRNLSLTNNHLVANTIVVLAGGVAGQALRTTIMGTRAINNTIRVPRDDTIYPSVAVIVANAYQCSIRDTIAINNHLESERAQGWEQHSSYTGIVTAQCYSSRIENTLAEHSELSAKGFVAVATAFADDCLIRNTTAKNIIIAARQQQCFVTGAAIAVAECKHSGNTLISQTTAINCWISASERTGYAAVGVGYKKQGCTTISNTTVCNSVIRGFRAGIAVSNTADGISRIFAFNTNLTSAADGITRRENTDCAAANCPKESPDASPGLLTTTTAGGNHIAADVLCPPLETPGKSTVTRTTTGSPDSPNAKTSLSANLSNSQSASSPASSLVNATDNGDTSSFLNTDEVDAGIPLPALAGGLAAGILTGGIMLYAIYQWYQGYQNGLRGTELALRPITRISDAIGCYLPAMELSLNNSDILNSVCVHPERS
ncbi:hypothetical protein, partial [Endozoicomonas sp. ONNA2]|uniref:hypothetical protein n=1 Tax=Endozoicomonas sp. ONNA2 TaxID=2828741 RepID=UPI002147B7E5